MSNHDGSYMLNEVFKLMQADHVFLRLGKKRSQSLVLSIIKLAAHQYDCNPMEIMEDLGERLGICGYGRKPAWRHLRRLPAIIRIAFSRFGKLPGRGKTSPPEEAACVGVFRRLL